jgi:hypothetical protein
VSDVLERLADELRAEGGLLAAALLAVPTGDCVHGRLAAAGPVAAGREDELALVVEAVREGYLLHYGTSRLLGDDDADLALLAGDRLYALGLARLADAGDLASVVELADVIALAAAAHAAQVPDLAEAVWEAGAAAVGWGASPELVRAKAGARLQAPGAAEALRAAARQLAGVLAP